MIYNHSIYQEEIARTLKELAHTDDKPHWHRIYGLSDIEELIANQVITSGYQLLTETNDDSRFIRDDNPVAREYYSFYVAKNFDSGDFASKETAKEGCKTIAHKIISKYIHDFKSDADKAIPNQDYGLSTLEVSSFSIRTFGPIGDNYIVTFVSFILYNCPDVAYNETDWDEGAIS